MHSLKKKDIIGTRKVERSIGSLCCPYDDSPFKLPADGKRNTSNFQNVDGHNICFSCEHVATRQWCGAWKVREYCRELGILTIYHMDTYKYLLKPNTKKNRLQLREAVLRNSGLGTHGIQQAEVKEAFAAGDIKEAQRKALWLSYTNIRSGKAKLACERNPDRHFLEAIGILKQATRRKTNT